MYFVKKLFEAIDKMSQIVSGIKIVDLIEPIEGSAVRIAASDQYGGGNVGVIAGECYLFNPIAGYGWIIGANPVVVEAAVKDSGRSN